MTTQVLTLPDDCPGCMAHLVANGGYMSEAFASVAIENGTTSGKLLRFYFARFHNEGH